MARSKRKTVGAGDGPAGEGSADRHGIAVPRWVPAVLMGVVTLLLFREFIFSDLMLYGEDTLSLGYMAREFYADALRDGVFPRWNPLLLGGIPFLDALAAGDSLYPTSLLLVLVEPYRALGWKLVLHVFLAGLFMFGWVRSLGRSRVAAVLSGLAFAVAPFLVSLVYPGHDGKIFVTALTPLMFWSMERTFLRTGLRPYALVAAVVALVLLTTHFQLAYFLFGAAGLYYIFRCWMLWKGVEGEGVHAEVAADGGGEDGDGPRRRPRSAAVHLGLFLAASVLGAAVAAVQLVPAFEHVTGLSRRIETTVGATPAGNRAYAASWSLHPEEAVSMVVPEFVGNTSGDAAWAEGTYWGRNPFKFNHEYAGLVVLLLAVAGFFGTPRRALRWFLAVLGVVALLYALGAHTPVWQFAYAVVPGVRLFRAPSMVSFLFGFSAITLMAFGVDRILGMARDPDGGKPKRKGEGHSAAGRLVLTLWALAGVLGLGVLLAAGGVVTTLWTSVVRPDIDPGRLAVLQAHQPFIVRGFFVAALLAGLTAGVAAAARRGVLKPVAVAGILGVLVFFDGFRISAPFVQTWDFYQWSTPGPLVRQLLDRQSTEPPFRVMSLTRQGQEVKPAMYGLELATGHHPNDLARYRELIGMAGSGMPQNILEPNVYRTLNVRYLIWPDRELGPAGAAEPLARSQLGGQPYESLYELPTLPRARLVASARVVPDEQAVEVIRSEGFDPATEAVLAEEPPLELGGGTVAGQVAWEERGLNRQRLTVTSDRNALLVVADNWYPAWKATVDGEEAPVLRAYHTLRAVPVGPGEHTVELRYDSAVLEGSLAVSLAAALLLGGVAVASTLRRRRERTDAGS